MSGPQFTSEQIEALNRKNRPLVQPTLRKLNPNSGDGFPPSWKGVLINEPKSASVDPKKPRKARQMNRTESRYAGFLTAQQEFGSILGWKYEGIRLKWGVDKDGNAMWFKPDFIVFREGQKMLCVEVKGAHIFDKAPVRYKGCRAEWDHVFDFEMWQWAKGEWTRKY